jgi:FixJ family two-component response regulator
MKKIGLGRGGDEKGAFDFLSRPVEVQRLIGTVDAAFAHNAAARRHDSQRRHALAKIAELTSSHDQWRRYSGISRKNRTTII